MDKDGKHLELFDSLPNLSAAIKNASVIARFGRLRPRTGTVYYVAHENANYRLRCYETKQSKAKRIPIILVPPLMISADVFDVAPDNSAVTYLIDQGYSVWLVDFGSPEHQEGGLDKDLTDHVLAVNDAIDYVYAEKRVPVHLAGYCQGGIFCYLATAYRQSNNVASIVTFGAPVNIYKNFLPGVPDEVTTKVFETIGKVFPKRLTPTVIPANVTKNLFKLMSPTKEIKNWISFMGSLHDRDALLQTEEGRSFLGGEGFVAWPGPALHQFLSHMLVGNRLVSGGCIIEGRAISLTEITCPILAVIGSNDGIARGDAVRGIADAVPNAELFELPVTAGHMAIVVGSRALKNTWPPVAQWVQWREGKAEQPESIYALGEFADTAASTDSRNDALPTAMVKAAFGMSKGAISTVGDLLGITKDSVQAITSNFSTRLSHLSRLEKLNSESKVGFALALEEQAEKAPKNTYFLYDGRAHSYADASTRVDNIVRGLISIGVRTGDHVGIIMHARPSSLATIMAVNRLGAVAVLLRTMRSSSQLSTELKLGKVQHLIADPENADIAETSFTGQVYILGGFGRSQRELPENVIDMEKIDPARVALPDWYQPSPGKAKDVAFIMFSDRGANTRCDSVTNHRWALSALGTASSTALMASDTVYCWTPLHDPAGLLVSVSASLVAGARVAVAKNFNASSFWQEARGYGARVVFYAGCMLRELVDAPENKLEKGHSIRLFAGVGMPEALSKRVLERFRSVKVMEIFVARGSNAYLANVSCKKPGPVVQSIPGSSDIGLVYWDFEKNQPFLDAAGYLCPVPVGSVGMLLAKADTTAGHHDSQPIYNVFEKGDCWQVSGDLFMVDEDGEYRFIDKVVNLIHTEDDWLPTLAIENAVWELDSISTAAAYGLSIEGYSHEVPAAAVLLRGKAKLNAQELTDVVTRQLDKKSRPVVIRIMTSMPMTLGQQIRKQSLRDEGIPESALQRGKSFWLNPKTAKYEPLNKTSLAKLKASLNREKTLLKDGQTSTTKTTPKKQAASKPKTKSAQNKKSVQKPALKRPAPKKPTPKKPAPKKKVAFKKNAAPKKAVRRKKSNGQRPAIDNSLITDKIVSITEAAITEPNGGRPTLTETYNSGPLQGSTPRDVAIKPANLNPPHDAQIEEAVEGNTETG
ncbi:MAG: acyl-CoA synthetase [Gammaproteobacteria bacterium]|nr:MAG: acyl-CoA synthetase [Gammaproteobacteria bacterium]RLA53126.1 MAG: acyl-CoA synthetase [Gammaproteobacteria bacterium]